MSETITLDKHEMVVDREDFEALEKSHAELLGACKFLINGLNQIPNQLIHGKHETTYKLIVWAEGVIKRVEVQS